MDYEELASKLLEIKADLLQVPANQKISKMLRGELFVLNYLAEHKRGVHPKELSEKLIVSTARIATLLNHMEEKGFIVRLEDPHDNRQIIVQLTSTGVETIEKTRRDVHLCIVKMLEDLGPEDAREYIRIQEKIYRKYLNEMKS